MEKLSAKRRGILALAAGFILASCGESHLPWTGKRYFSMDTWVSVQTSAAKDSGLDEAFLAKENDAIGAIFDQVNNYADATAPHDVVSVYDINKAEAPIEIGEGLHQLLSFSLRMQQETAGYFNPLCGALADLWKWGLRHARTDGTNRIPDPQIPVEADIDEALISLRNSSLILGERNGKKTAFLSRPSGRELTRAKLDLGGIAKGYAAEIARKKLKEDGVRHYLVNGGNSSILFGENIAKDGYFSMGWAEDLPGYRINAKNVVVGTSSVSVQGQEIDGVVYSHIVNPFTGEAAPALTGVTLLGSDAGILDALSTALIWAPEGKREELERKFDLKAVYYKDKQVIANHDFPLLAQ